MVGRLLVGFVCLNLQFSVSWLVDFQWGSCGSIFMFSVSWLIDFWWGSCGSIFSFLCHGWQTFSGARVAQSLVFCVMVGRFQWGSCGSIFRFLCHGRYTFSGVRVAQSFVFCVMVGILLVGFVLLNLQFSVSWQVDFQWGSCGSIFSFLYHDWQTFSGVRVAQSLVFCVMIGKFLVGFVWLNLQFSVSWQVDFQWASCVSIFSFLCYSWYTFSGVPVAQSFVFCVMVGRLLVGFVRLNLQFSVSWQVDFQWGSYGSILIFCVMVGRLLVRFVWLNLQLSVLWLVDFQWGSCGSNFNFLCHGWQTFSGVRVAQSLVFCVMVGRLLVGFVWLNLQFYVSWQVDFQWGSCGSIFSFLCHGRQTFSGFVWLNLQFSVSWLVNFQWGSCGSIFSFLCHGRQIFSGLRVSQSLVFCVMVGRLLVGFVWLNLQFSVSWLVDFQWGSCGSIFMFSVSWLVDIQWVPCGSIFSFLCHGWQTFSGVRAAQSLVFCVMVGRHLVGFVWLNFQFSVSWLVDFQWASCGSIFRFLCHCMYTFIGVREAQSFFFVSWLVDFQWGSCGSIFSFLCHGWQTFSGLRVAQSLDFCVMAGILLVGFVWLNLQISVSWQVDFQWGSCGSISSFLCHGRQTFSRVRMAQSLAFCVMVGKFLVGFVWLNLQFFVSWLVDFQWGFVLLNLQISVSWLVNFQWGSCGSIFSFLCYGWQTFSGVPVALSFVFCVMVGILLLGFVWLNLLFFVSWLVDFQWGSCGSIFSFLCHGRQTFSGVRVAQSLVFCVMVGRLLVGFVWLNLSLSVSWLVNFQWCSCGSIFSFLCYGWQTFSGVPVALSFVFCVMVGRLLVGFVWLNLQFSVLWQVDFQWGSCGSIFSFLCHG